MYNFFFFFYDMYHAGIYKSPFLSSVETILNELGLSGMWINQYYLNVSNQWLRDQYVQNWQSEITSKEIYYNYKMF